MFLLIHNSNVRNIQVCDCICAELRCEIDTELCASLLHSLLFLCWGWRPAEFLWLSLCCNSAMIWKVSDVVSGLEDRRRRRWSIIPQAEQFFRCLFFCLSEFSPCHIFLHHVLLNYANIYQVISYKVQANVRRHGIAGLNLLELFELFSFFYFSSAVPKQRLVKTTLP